jgi:hypothetical protein
LRVRELLHPIGGAFLRVEELGGHPLTLFDCLFNFKFPAIRRRWFRQDRGKRQEQY